MNVIPKMNLSLPERETAFHNQWAESEDVDSILVDESFESETTPENRRIVQWLGDIHGLSILDLGCGCGEASVYFAKRGARVTASDLSSGMLDLTKRVGEKHGVTLETVECGSESLPFPDGTFDIVYGANVLHHSNLEKALSEVKRVLKPGGRACFWDPLANNPIINVYRRMAHQVRTADEHPLTSRDLATIRATFPHAEFRYYWFFTLAVFLKFYLIDWVHPNTERYWKKVIREAGRNAWLYRPLAFLDRIVLTICPPARWFCWNVVACAKKES
ncbi:MAG: class I SAM-dependent methyltransferase [Gemmataceae bacterium]